MGVSVCNKCGAEVQPVSLTICGVVVEREVARCASCISEVSGRLMEVERREGVESRLVAGGVSRVTIYEDFKPVVRSVWDLVAEPGSLTFVTAPPSSGGTVLTMAIAGRWIVEGGVAIRAECAEALSRDTDRSRRAEFMECELLVLDRCFESRQRPFKNILDEFEMGLYKRSRLGLRTLLVSRLNIKQVSDFDGQMAEAVCELSGRRMVTLPRRQR